MEKGKSSARNFGAKGWFLIIYSFLCIFLNTALVVDGLNVALPLVTEANGLIMLPASVWVQ